MLVYHIMAVVVAATLLVLLGRLSLQPTLRRLRAELVAATARADHDALTGLPNRRRAEALTSGRLAAGRLTTVALLDLDHFKQVNDVHGHSAGDQLLVVVAERLHAEARRAGGFAARLGGDEFVAVLPTDDSAEAVGSILAALHQPAEIDGEVTLTPCASVGISLGKSPVETWSSLLRQADLALYQAKRSGERCVTYSPVAGNAVPGGRDWRRHDQNTAQVRARAGGAPA